MNKSVVTLFGLTVLLLFFSFIKNKDEVTDTGAIGDVKYSILESAEFNKQNGPGWVLLSGSALPEVNKLYQSSTLKGICGIPSLPDARGVFLRGMNNGRDVLTGDADNDRKVGDLQGDIFKAHSHPIHYYTLEHWDMPSSEYAHAGPVMNEGALITGKPTDSIGGNETRPRNIALYIYIKIN